MIIKLRTWNINFWLNPRKARTARTMEEKAKSPDEINEWIVKSKNILKDDIFPEVPMDAEDVIQFLLLQEVSPKLFGRDDFRFKDINRNCEIHYEDTYYPHNPFKWGLSIVSNGKAVSTVTSYCPDKAFMSYTFQINYQIVTIINIHARTAYSSWNDILNYLKPFINQNSDHLLDLFKNPEDDIMTA